MKLTRKQRKKHWKRYKSKCILDGFWAGLAVGLCFGAMVGAVLMVVFS